MEFLNHTPFPALAFEGIDQHDQSFHVVVLRQTLTFASGKLEYAEAQAPLCEVDEFFGAMNESSVRQESDLCQFKPKCDLIVNATAYAPGHKPTSTFNVRLLVTRPGASPRLPEPPRGLNPTMSASAADMAAWRREIARIKAEGPPVLTLIDKTLTVMGPRVFEKPGIFGLGDWKLTNPQEMLSLPLRYEYAFGGQCRINADHSAAQRIPKHCRLTPEQIAQHPEPILPPVAHTVFEPNIVGRGYAESWFLDATNCTSLPAPQIDHPNAPINVELFSKIAQGKIGPTDAVVPAGFGIRSKVHPQRRAQLGTVDDAFIKSDAWLPKDFNFAIWNAAPSDQQTEYLTGEESITLTNLCKPESPLSRSDTQGNAVLTIPLPGDECYVLIRMADGLIAAQPLVIDTVLCEPDSLAITLVWRTVLAKLADASISVLEARMRSREAKQRNYGDESYNREKRAELLTTHVISRIMSDGTPKAGAIHG